MPGTASLSGSVGVVTGGTSGIGAAVVGRCVANGATVAFCGRSRRPAAPQVGEYYEVDVRRYNEVEAFCSDVHRRFGRLDFAVTSAGVTLPGRLDDGDPSLWRGVLETNVLGTANVVRAVLPLMRSGCGGHVVLVGSIAGRGTHAGEPVYLASKWAVVGMAAALRRQLRPAVKVSLVEPGLVDSPMSRNEPGLAHWLSLVEPLQPDDVASAVEFALSQPPRVSINNVIMRPSLQEL
jgi:NADP-dependent 3-hydroxy acid dehydrogenase YdfG